MKMATTTGGKAAVRLAVQKEVFTPADERLQGLTTVSKPGRKRKISFLCVSTNQQEKPTRVFISRVKPEEQRKDKRLYRRVKKWELTELRIVDGRSQDTEVPEFDLHFEKGVFKWVANSVAEKKAFIVCLYKMVHKHMARKKPAFNHIDLERLQEMIVTAEAGARRSGEAEESTQQDEYQELTEREQEDLERMLKEEEEKAMDGGTSGIQDIEAFTEHLSQQLAQLDDANIHTLMDSETQIHTLMTRIDKTLLEIKQMEMKLSVYDELLGSVRVSMSKLTKDYSAIMTWDTNLKALYDQVLDIVEKLDLDPHVERVLSNPKLSTDSGIKACSIAISDLHEVMSHQLSQGVQVMQAVSEQKSHFAMLSHNFGAKLKDHLCSTFTSEAVVFNDGLQTRQAGLPFVSAHGNLHGELMKYSDLMRWMRECENQKFLNVCEAYCFEFQRVYNNQIRAFMADVKSMMGRGHETKKGGFGGVGSSLAGGISSRLGSTADISMTSFRGSSANLGSPSLKQLSTSLMDFSQATGGGKNPTQGIGDQSDKPRFDQVFLLVLDQLQPLCQSEQKFCNSFFHFPRDENEAQSGVSVSPLPSQGEGQDDDEDLEDIDGFRDKFGLLSKRQQHKDTIDVGLMAEGVNGLLKILFECLPSELETMIMFGEKIDQYNSLYLLVSVTQRVMFAHEGKPSYLDKCLSMSLVVLKRLVDKLVASTEKSILDCKVPRKSGKCGVLPCVLEFSRFAERVERIIMGTDRRKDIDRAYERLIISLFGTIDHLAEEHPKTPRNVVLCENYYTLFDKLSVMKIQCLEKHREDAKKRYKTYQEEYVVSCLGKPLEKLSTFFDGVERLLVSGVKAEQVGFYRDYNKGELQKCIQAYPGKEVKRGLEKLYRRIEKDLTEEVGLLRVVWGSMQKSFMEQYRHFTELINQCYPNANISLEFELQNIIDYFQSISDNKH